jgi:hypothetical protein
MQKQYFVTVMAGSKRMLRGLQQFDLDVFQQTAKSAGDKTFSIEGLLSLDDVARLVDSGYQVLVEEPAAKRARAQVEIIEFEQWLKGMEE